VGFLGFVGFNPKIPPSQPHFYWANRTLFFPRIRLTAIPNPTFEPINPGEGELHLAALTLFGDWGILSARKDALESADSPGNSGVRWMRRSHRLPFLS
jgi:hypothetical protein